ncbi:hypothetical protein EV127DRAFT_497736 [Xylaria flabelliformis]|nr:hypothetical protein EV127DRAFT_497736 [Xylaria flabelliformis]
MLEQKDQKLDFDSEQSTDVFDFALNWPMNGVFCASYGEGSDKIRSVQNPQSSPWSLRLGQSESTPADRNAVFRGGLQKAAPEANISQPPWSDNAANFCIRRPSNFIMNMDSDGLQDTQLMSMHMSSPCDQQERKIERTTYVPFEIMAMIISQTLVAPPKCAINLVVPDWSICERETPQVEKLLRITRIVTYVRGMDFQVGTLSCRFSHKDKDHILTPDTDFDLEAFALDVRFASEYTRQFWRSHTHVFTLGTADIPHGMFEKALGSDWGNLLPLRNHRLKAILPFDDEPIDVVKKRSSLVPIPIHQYIRHIAVHSPLELMQMTAENLRLAGYIGDKKKFEALNNALDLERSAHLWLSWSKMPKLESVFLDLRIYSHDLNTKRRCLNKSQVMDRAQEMGRHLQLKTLVLAGLQSYSFNVAYDGVTARDVENCELIDNEPNWIKIFRPAIRGGGKIVLVDRLTDEFLA